MQFVVGVHQDAGSQDETLGSDMKLPTARRIDRRLLVGSILFGIGWGVAGFCPGPALVAMGMGEVKAMVFVAAMLAGMGVFELLERRAGRGPLQPQSG